MSQPLALITGASSGLGADFAREFAARGYDLFVTARRTDRLESLKQEIESTHRNRVYLLSADLGAPEGAQEILDELKKQELRVHTLINNAGMARHAAFVDRDDWDQTIQVNVTSLVNLTNALLPDMFAQKAGQILNVSSIAAFQAMPWMSIYAASKAFVLSFTEGLAEELKGRNIKISCLCPGGIRTEFSQASDIDETKYPDFVFMESVDVVREAIKALERNELIYVPGAINKASIAASKFLPRSWTRKSAGKLYQLGDRG